MDVFPQPQGWGGGKEFFSKNLGARAQRRRAQP